MDQAQALAAYQANLAQGVFDSTFNSTSGLTTGVGRLNADDATAFINYVIDQSFVKNAATNIKTDAPERRVSFTGINSNVLRPGVTCVDPGTTTTASVSEVIFRPQLIKAEAKLCDEELEDNIERDGFRATFMGMLARQIANQLETAFLIGKKTTGTPVNVNQQFNGWVTTAIAAGHVIDGSTLADGAAGANTRLITTKKLKVAMRKIPTKYFDTPDNIRYIVSPGPYLDFAEVVSLRPTSLGDTAFRATPAGGNLLNDQRWQGVSPFGYLGFNLYRAPLFPENMYAPKSSGGVSTTLNGGLAVNATTAVLTTSTGIAVGEVVKIAGNGADTGQDEVVTVTANNTGTNTITFANNPLAYAHSTGNAAVSGTGDGTAILTTSVENLVVVWRRDIQIEWWRDTRAGAWYVNVSMRVDSGMINPDAASVVTNVKSEY